MPSQELKKRAIYFFGFAVVIVLILLVGLPFVENWLQLYFLENFGLSFTSEGRTVTSDGSPPGMMIETSVSLFVNILHILKIILWMALVISIVRFIGYLIFGNAFRSGQSEISSLLKTVFSIIIYVVAFFIIFQSQYPGVQLAPLFTGSAILGIVVGLALQDTLGNLFAGIALQADAPFQVGDVVNIAHRETGIVESVSWRGVKIRTFQNKLLVISNAVLGKEMIEVSPHDNLNARLVTFNTLYSISPARTAQLIREAVRQVENVSSKMRPIVRIRDLGENAIDWEVKYWPDDYRRFNDTDALVRQKIWYVFQREGLEFAFPTRSVYIEKKRPEATVEQFVDSVTERLSNIPIFAPLSDEETEQLAKASAVRVFAPMEPIVRMGQEGNSMFVIIRGQVKVQIPEMGSPKTVNELRENDFFGEMSLLTGQPRSATVVASEETEVLQIKKSALKRLFDINPDLVRSISEIMEERQKLLVVEQPATEHITDEVRGVLRSIKNFFGI
ncbi:MAG: mechanosensitive ion channel family protein [Pyrinomonadaceae bacterium]